MLVLTILNPGVDNKNVKMYIISVVIYFGKERYQCQINAKPVLPVEVAL